MFVSFPSGSFAQLLSYSTLFTLFIISGTQEEGQSQEKDGNEKWGSSQEKGVHQQEDYGNTTKNKATPKNKLQTAHHVSKSFDHTGDFSVQSSIVSSKISVATAKQKYPWVFVTWELLLFLRSK